MNDNYIIKTGMCSDKVLNMLKYLQSNYSSWIFGSGEIKHAANNEVVIDFTKGDRYGWKRIPNKLRNKGEHDYKCQIACALKAWFNINTSACFTEYSDVLLTTSKYGNFRGKDIKFVFDMLCDHKRNLKHYTKEHKAEMLGEEFDPIKTAFEEAKNTEIKKIEDECETAIKLLEAEYRMKKDQLEAEEKQKCDELRAIKQEKIKKFLEQAA